MYTFWFPQELDQNLNIPASSRVSTPGTFPRGRPPHNSLFFQVPLAAHQSVSLSDKKGDLPCVYSVCGFQFCSPQCFFPELQVRNPHLHKVNRRLAHKHKLSRKIRER